MRKTVEPTETIENGTFSESVLTHPAYGQCAVSKPSGSAVLYGSDFTHQNYVSLTVYESELHRSLSHDRHFHKRHLIEIAMSEAQWATLVSSFGQGSGVPCTIHHVVGDKEARPKLPLRDTHKLYTTEATKNVGDALAGLQRLQMKVAEGVKGLSKVKQAEILGPINDAISAFTSSIPFISESFAKHMEDTVEKAKVEVHAYIGNAIHSARLDALGAPPPLQLGHAKDTPDV